MALNLKIYNKKIIFISKDNPSWMPKKLKKFKGGI